MHILTGSGQPAVVNQVDLEVSGAGFIPGDAAHGDIPQAAIGGLGSLARQAGLILREALETASEGGDAHPGELVQLAGGEFKLTVLGQVLGQPNEVGLQAFGADVVHGFGDSPQDRV